MVVIAEEKQISEFCDAAVGLCCAHSVPMHSLAEDKIFSFIASKFVAVVTYHSNTDFHFTLDEKQEAQLMLTTGSTRLTVSRGQQTGYHSTCYI